MVKGRIKKKLLPVIPDSTFSTKILFIIADSVMVEMLPFTHLRAIGLIVLLITLVAGFVQASSLIPPGSQSTLPKELLIKLASQTNAPSTPFLPLKGVPSETVPASFTPIENNAVTSFTYQVQPLLSDMRSKLQSGPQYPLLHPYSPPGPLISKGEAIAIATDACGDITLTRPPVAKLGTCYLLWPEYGSVWTVTIEGVPKTVPADRVVIGRAGGIVTIDAKTGEVIDINVWRS